jgi:hypothetical protein
MIADELNGCTVHQIITQELNMRRVCAKMVPENLNDDQKACRIEVSEEMLERIKTEPDFFNGVMTGEGSSFFEYNP